jgi:hypothetical protein
VQTLEPAPDRAHHAASAGPVEIKGGGKIMDIQRLRNFTTGRLHTNMDDVYEDLEIITGKAHILTHQIPNICRAMDPYLRVKIKDPRFWEDKYDTTHTGEIELPAMDETARAMFNALLNILEGERK